jgi:hypothetical protein
MKPNPFYQNERERLELQRLRDSFTWDEPPPETYIIVVAGQPGDGKTHLLCTMNELGPVYLLDSEYRAHLVSRKFSNVKVRRVSCYRDLVVAVKYILKNCEPGSIVLDSGSDLQQFAEVEYLERTGKEQVGMPYNWGEVYWLCNALIDEIKKDGRFHLALSARLKEEYMNEKATGKLIPRLYSNLPYKADLALQFGKNRIPHLLKNGFTGDTSVPLTREMTLPEIIKLSSGAVPEHEVASVTARPSLRIASKQ